MSFGKVFNNTIPVRVSVANWDENTGGGDVDADISNINRNVAQVHNSGGGLINSESTIHDRMADSNLHLESIEENTQTIISKMQNSADLTTVNDNTTQIATNTELIDETLGSSTDTTAKTTVIGRLANIQQQSILANTALGTANSTQNANDIIGKLKQVQLNGANTYTQVSEIQNATDVINVKLGAVNEAATSGTVLGRLTSLKNDNATIATNTTTIKSAIGEGSDTVGTSTISGKLSSLNNYTSSNYSMTLALRNNVGFTSDANTANTVIGLLKGIKENGTSSGGVDMTTVNTNTTDIKTLTDDNYRMVTTIRDNIGLTGDNIDADTVIGILKGIRTYTINTSGHTAALGATTDESTANTVIGLLKRIIQNN